MPFKIGTRGSLLAVTQCTLIKNEIENKTGERFELQTIKTQGDQIVDKPLWQLEGKDFFTKELDEALLANSVDMVVHSYKDLGSIRPDKIYLASITKRKFAHDILLIRNETLKALSSKKEFVVGTSSPRRQVNLTQNLSDFIPFGHQMKISCESLRGNVNTRIQKLRDGQYDAITLALAGLERLANKEDSKETLKELLNGMNFLLLPQKDFTSAASQGALAIECHESNENLKNILSSVHDEITAEEIKRERAAFNSYGGGCHLAVGIYVKKVQDFFLHFHLGQVDDKKISVRMLEGYDYSTLKDKSVYYVYGENDFLIKKLPIENKTKDENYFVTSSHCFHQITPGHNSLWSAGNRTFKKLVEKGYWVNASAEGLGHDYLNELKESEVVKIMLQNNKWSVLSHKDATSPIGQVLPGYSHELNKDFDKAKLKEIMSCDIIYWSSFIQYQLYTKQFPELANKQHASGLGKTLTQFTNNNIHIIPCIDMKHLASVI